VQHDHRATDDLGLRHRNALYLVALAACVFLAVIVLVAVFHGGHGHPASAAAGVLTAS
jgi:negative regulator of sigma E activity